VSKLPCDECKGRCCTYPGFLRQEYKNVRDKHGIPKGTISRNLGFIRVLYKTDGTCPFLKDGACSIYEDRPNVCKKYGEVPQLPCQYLHPEAALRSMNTSIGGAL
jgi:Fe-S-cluster containining protein